MKNPYGEMESEMIEKRDTLNRWADAILARDEARAERDELRQAARAVLDAYADGADLNTLYDVIQTELAPLVEPTNE